MSKNQPISTKNSSGLGSINFTEVKLGPGAAHDLKKEVPSIGTRLSWHISVLEKDCGFSIVRALDGKTVLSYIRLQEDIGSLICEQAGTYIIKLDNSYSNFKAKVVKYKFGLDNPFAINSAVVQ